MDEYYDDDFQEKTWKKKQGKKKKISTNPKGAYQIDIVYRGVEYDVTIQNVALDKFKVCAIMKDEDYDETIKDEDYQPMIMALNKYLEDEGFFMAAKKWNLFYE